MQSVNRHSCVACARRKVKCDKLSPCSSCSRTQAACIYRAPAPSHRHRRRLTHSDLLSKIQELETALQSNNIPFEPLSTTWIHSSWEEKLDKSPQTQAGTNSSSSVELVEAAEAPLTAQDVEASSPNTILGGSYDAARLWSELSKDLKNPVISQVKRLAKDEEEQSDHLDTSSGTPFIFPCAQLSAAPGQLGLHPNPKHVFKFWQTFADNVNPLTKIIHAPSLQQKILNAAWTAESVPKPLEATMFAVYALAVSSMTGANCIQTFGETRSVLLSRYRMGALQALSRCDLLSTRDLEVLQALALVLMIDPQSELSVTAVALAMRIAHKMGLHRAGEGSDTPFFEQEMKVRLWWYIRGLNSRVRRAMGLLSTIDDLGDARLPMNVNDADLHPQMAGPPAVQHTAATEMVYVLMNRDPREKAAQLTASTSVEGLAKKRTVLAEVERMLQEKYLDHLDPSIPLHRLAIALAGATIHRQRFLMFHPRHQPEGGRYMSQADQDAVFESSVRLLELDNEVRTTSFSTALVENMACRTQVEALVYMVSELRQRTSGRLVETAWALLEQMHHEQPAVMQGGHKFYTALADLTLEAWEARWQALGRRSEAVPKFIEMLLVARGEAGAADEAQADVGGLPSGFMDDLLYDGDLDWNSWNDFLPL